MMKYFSILFFILLYCAPATADRLAPDFEGKLLSGESFALADHIGKDMVVLNFFTTSCAPCREEMPALSKFYDEHKDKVVILGVDVIEGEPVVKAFVENMKISYPVIIDSGELTKSLNVTGYPTTVVIGLDGNIQFQFLNPIDVPGVLGPLLEKQRTGISRDEFLKRQEKTIHVVTPEVKPVAGSESAGKNEIFGITVASDTPQQLDVDVDYYYSGDHGTTRIYIDCDPHTADGGAPFAMRPAAVEVGRHTARAPLMSYDGTPPGTVSTVVTCHMSSRLDSSRLATKTIDFKKTWGK
jgi:thiol-disulfide isomerase/thioredoxin